MIWKTLKYIFGGLCALGLFAILFNEFLIGIILILGFALLFTIACICDYLFTIKNNTSDIKAKLQNIYNTLIYDDDDNNDDSNDDMDDEVKKQSYINYYNK